MNDNLVKLMGWPATILHGDPSVFDRWRWLKRHLRPGPLRTLDAGCGSGAFTMYAAKIGNFAVGLTNDGPHVEGSRRRAALLGIGQVEFLQADLRQLDALTETLGRFDQIICFETIEHIKNDRKLLRDLARLLRPDGRLLLTTPHRGYHPLLGDVVSPEEDGGHVRWGYTHAELAALFGEAGLELRVREYISGWVSQRLLNLLRRAALLVGSRLAWGLTFPLRILQCADVPLTRRLGYPYLSVGVIGVKCREP